MKLPKLLLTAEEINAMEIEGVKNARTFSEMAAAMQWAQNHRDHPWRSCLWDVLGDIAQAGALGFGLNVKVR